MSAPTLKATDGAGHGAGTGAASDPVRVGAGDLYREHAGFVAGFLVRMGARQMDVADLTQEVFLVAHRRGGYVPGPARPTTWLAEIAVRVLSTHRRTGRRKPASPAGDLVHEVRADVSGVDDRVEAARGLERIQRCLDLLDDDHRSVFVLFELEGEPCAAIAAALGVPVGTVYSRLHHARRRVLAAWGEGGDAG